MVHPATRLIRRTARDQWRLLALATIGNLGRALLEGASLGTVYLAVEVASQGTLPAWWPALTPLPSQRLFMLLILLAVGLKAAQALLQYLSSVSVEYVSARCFQRIQALIHQRILEFGFGHASSYRVGDLTELANTGPAAVERQIAALNNLFTQGLMGVAYLVVLISLSPWLLLAAAAIGAVVGVLQRHLLPRIRRTAYSLSHTGVAISSRLIEDIQALRLLHSLGQLDAAVASFQAALDAQEQARRRQSRLTAALDPLDSLLPILVVSAISLVSVGAFGARVSGVLPSLVTFVLALQRMNMVLNIVAQSFTSLNANAADLERLNRFLLPSGQPFRRRGGVPFDALRQGIRFEQVGLRYGPQEPWVLRQLSLELPHGHTLALVGPSGAGKSSIADLLTGLYEPSEGSIFIDGHNLGQLDLGSWQRRLGVVSQDTFLFNASVAANIAFGCLGVSRDQIEAAAAQAQATGFIAELPEGYDTLLGERGHRLSGGQRQRLSLARALLRDPDLLILDEATSALDSQSEWLLQQALANLERQPTLLVIAHRLSTVRQADQIVVLKNGQIVERGRHEQLIEHPQGLYRQLWNRQSEQQEFVLSPEQTPFC